MSNLHYPCVQVRVYDEYGMPVPALGSLFLQVEDIFRPRREPPFENSTESVFQRTEWPGSSVNNKKGKLERDIVPDNLYEGHRVSQIAQVRGDSGGTSRSTVGNSPSVDLRGHLEEETVSLEGNGENDVDRRRRVFLEKIAKDLNVDPDDIEISIVGPGHPDYSGFNSEGFPLPSKTVGSQDIIDLTEAYPMEDGGNTMLGSIEPTQVIDLTGDELGCSKGNSMGDQDSGMALERESLFDFVKRCFPLSDMDGPGMLNTC